MGRSSNIAGPVPDEVLRAAEDIYIYGYPLVLMDTIRRIRTETLQSSASGAPINQFAHMRFLPGPSDKGVSYPNLDSLCSSAWIDLHKAPVVLSVPQIDRYHLLSFWSSWYEIFETLSPRNSDTRGGHFAFTGPGWHGNLPEGMRQILSPTATVFIDGYFEVNGAEDLQVVHHLQDQFRLTPLKDWGHSLSRHSMPVCAEIDRKTAPQEQVWRLGSEGFYSQLSKLLERNPAHQCDTEILAEFSGLGFVPSEYFTYEKLPPKTAQAMQHGVAAAQKRMMKEVKNRVNDQTFNGWSLHIHPGSYGTNYLQRALGALAGIPVSLAQDTIWFHAAIDHTGQPLTGLNRYVIDFARNETPPVNSFWSITLYDSAHHVVRNDVHRYVIGDRSRLRVNSDSSISIYVQHEWPGEFWDSNWLPAPKDSFSLALRLSWPKPEAVALKWFPPSIIRIN